MAIIDRILKSKSFYIVIACIASVLLWMYVSNYENTTQTVTLTGLEVNYIGGEDILQMGGPFGLIGGEAVEAIKERHPGA